MILVSDGAENRSPYIDDVKPTVVNKRIIVHTILVGDKADKRLIKLSAATRGVSFFDSGLYKSSDLESAFRSSVTLFDDGAPGVTPVEVCIIQFRHLAIKLIVTRTRA